MFSHTHAQHALAQICATQQQHGQPVTVAIADDHGELLAFTRMDGAALHTGVLAQNKAWTAARDRQATQDLGAWSRSSGRPLASWTDPRFTGFGGGVPVWKDGRVIGAVGVSGLSEDEDHRIAMAVAHLLVNAG